MTTDVQSSLFGDIYKSFLTLPTWVKIWAGLFLGPLNMLSIAFINEPGGLLVAVLAWSGMMISMAVLFKHRGFSRLVSGGHVVVWPFLIAFLVFARPEATGAYATFLTVLLISNGISLVFDIIDLRKWMQGEREVPGLGRSV